MQTQLALMKAYPRGKKGEKDWEEIVKKVKLLKKEKNMIALLVLVGCR